MSDPGPRNGNGENGHVSPFLEIDRDDWAALAPTVRAPLTETEITELSGLGEPLDLIEVEQVYLPLSRLLAIYAESSQYLHGATSEFLGTETQRTPFVIAVAGSVAVGKSTVSRLLRELLSRWEDTPRVELVTTDGFLLPNAELERRGILDRKGFPESYDRRALLRFVSEVKSGKSPVNAPVYSHLSYDVTDKVVSVERPDVLIIEGLNVLQPPTHGAKLAVSDLFDFTIYVDARTSDIERWYVERFLVTAARRLQPPRLLLPPLRLAQRGGGAGASAGHLDPHQPAEPRAEHPADTGARRPGAAEGGGSHRRDGVVAEGVTRSASRACSDSSAGRSLAENPENVPKWGPGPS